ncbi:MAG: hypothetical protein M0Q40_10995 [Limnochordia bacterium]|jgi:hypothetical protein|nr:hypothetical protein [Limnochordia bacterium]
MQSIWKYGAVLLAVLAIGGCFHLDEGIDGPEFELITAPFGQPTRHWWEDVLWKSGVELDNKSIEIKYTGDRVLINYFKFVPVDGTEPVIWTDFVSLHPAEALIEADGSQVYVGITDKWGIRIDANMGATGEQSLTAHANMQPLPNLTFNPGLTGKYNIYVNVRAVDAVSCFGLRMIDSE